VSTYLLAGLPVISDRRPGYYRYDELRRLGAGIELVDGDYDDLQARLEAQVRTRDETRSAREARDGYSFDATRESLLGGLERARASYFSKPHAERSRLLPTSCKRERERPPAGLHVPGEAELPEEARSLFARAEEKLDFVPMTAPSRCAPPPRR